MSCLHTTKLLIAFCCNNQPGAFVSLVVKLGNLELPATTELRNVNPCFYNNFTYTLRIPSTKNAYPFFVFRGDAFLTAKPLKMNGFDEITSSINGNKEFRSKIEAVLTEMNAGKESCSTTCGYNTRCPVSNGHTRQHLPIRRQPYRPEQNACIKIVGCNDEIPGSFALALSDLLMMNATIRTTGNVPDLVYCASSICDYPQRFINRFYLQFKKPDSSEQTLEALNRQRSIVAIKIKPVKPTSKSWQLIRNRFGIVFKQRLWQT